MERCNSYRSKRNRRAQRYRSNCLHLLAGVAFWGFFALGVFDVISIVQDKTQAASKLPDIIFGAPINSAIAEYDYTRMK